MNYSLDHYIPEIIRNLLHMCQHRNCWNIFIPTYEIGFCGIIKERLCLQHKHHIYNRSYDCFPSRFYD